MGVDYLSLPPLDEQVVHVRNVRNADRSRSYGRRAVAAYSISAIACIMGVALVRHSLSLQITHTMMSPTADDDDFDPVDLLVEHRQGGGGDDDPYDEYYQQAVQDYAQVPKQYIKEHAKGRGTGRGTGRGRGRASPDDYYQQVVQDYAQAPKQQNIKDHAKGRGTGRGTGTGRGRGTHDEYYQQYYHQAVQDYAQVPQQYIKKHSTSTSGATVTLTLSESGNVVDAEFAAEREVTEPLDASELDVDEEIKVEEQDQQAKRENQPGIAVHLKEAGTQVEENQLDVEGESILVFPGGSKVQREEQEWNEDDHNRRLNIFALNANNGTDLEGSNSMEQKEQVATSESVSDVDEIEVEVEVTELDEDESSDEEKEESLEGENRLKARRLIKVGVANANPIAQVGDGTDQEGSDIMEQDDQVVTSVTGSDEDEEVQREDVLDAEDENQKKQQAADDAEWIEDIGDRRLNIFASNASDGTDQEGSDIIEQDEQVVSSVTDVNDVDVVNEVKSTDLDKEEAEMQREALLNAVDENQNEQPAADDTEWNQDKDDHRLNIFASDASDGTDQEGSTIMEQDEQVVTSVNVNDDIEANEVKSTDLDQDESSEEDESSKEAESSEEDNRLK